MLCSRFPWLTANVKETTRGSKESPLLGSSWTRKKQDWHRTDTGSILGNLGDFQYQPSDGILQVPLSEHTTLCLAGLTTPESASKKYGKPVLSKLPKNAQAKRFSASPGWQPTHAPKGGCAGGEKCSVKELLLSCPVNGPPRPGEDGEEVFEAVIGEGSSDFTFYEDWRKVLPGLLERARLNCSTLVLVTHLKFAEDMEVLKSDPLISAVLGGHDHEPKVYLAGDGGPVEQHSGVVVKVGLDGQYVAKVDVLFSEDQGKGKFDHVLFDMRPASSVNQGLCRFDSYPSCQPADILPVDGQRLDPLNEPSNERMQGLMQAFEALTEEFTSDHVAKTFNGTFDTLSVRSRETSAANLYTDSLSRWAEAERTRCDEDPANCVLQDGGKAARGLPVVALVNSGTIRSNDYAEGTYPDNRPFSMLEVRADLPFEDQIAVWVMPVQDLLVVLAMVVTDFGDGMFPLAGGLEFMLIPKEPQEGRLSVATGVRGRPVAAVRFRQAGEEEHAEASLAFAKCMTTKLKHYDTLKFTDPTGFDWECPHFGRWMQDTMKRGSEVLVVGPEFMRVEAMKMVDEVVRALNATELRTGFAGVGIPGEKLAERVRDQRKGTHMKNLVEKRLIIYDIVRDELRQHFEQGTRPIMAGNDCIAPSLADLHVLSHNLDRSLDWALGAARVALRAARDHSGERLCFRTRALAQESIAHVTDELQLKSSSSTEDMMSALEGRCKKHYGALKKVGRVLRKKIVAEVRQRVVKRTTNKTDLPDDLLQIASGKNFEKLQEAWQAFAASRKDARAFLGNVDIGDLLQILGPNQWLNDTELSYLDLFENQEAAGVIKRMWSEWFLLPEQSVEA